MPVLGVISCHPPIIIPEVGRGETKRVERTIAALKLAAEDVNRFKPELTLLMSPHAAGYRGSSVPVQVTDIYVGDFGDFMAPHVSLRYQCASEEAYAVKQCGGVAIRYGALDHGSMVPLYYLKPESPLVVMGYAFGMDTRGYIDFGSCLRRLFEDKKVLFIASADLSHRLLPGAPAGYHPRARDFDVAVVDAVREWNLERYLSLEDMREIAGECGYWSIATLFGFMGSGSKTEVLSYEGPFGVGYLVAIVRGE
ncbi:hypothetical protein HPY42_02915 [Coprothermobacteraceae bacterium]|nr:hypothetical protein [Coprothermobacteraceae bacterium]